MTKQSQSQTGLRPLSYEKHPWDPRTAYASRGVIRRHSGPYKSAIPIEIAGLDPIPLFETSTLAEADEATHELIRFDEYVEAKWGLGPEELAPMSATLLRTESASSSQIENLTVGARQLALAELGERTSPNARLVSANVRALRAALRFADEVSVDAILEMHDHLLEREDPEAGRLRTQQVWIGGSGIGPHLASFVPPHHDRLPALIDDLIDFCRRVDIPPLVQISIAHAQFETIHPFTDGNGRTGRALVQAMLRGSGLTRRTTVPVSAGLLVDTDRYFAALASYREGDVQPILKEFGQAARYAAVEGRKLVTDLDFIRVETASRIKARSDAAVWRLNDLLVGQPVVNTAYVASRLDISKVAAQTSIDKLVDAGALTENTNKVRRRVWQHNDILARLDEFAARVRRRDASP
ncbi:MAG: Fic family protein [Thermoleophilia bacterium]|nr:Fic family protein [Thermoleophilia bacterium]